MGYSWDFGIDEDDWTLKPTYSYWTFSDGHDGFGCIEHDPGDGEGGNNGEMGYTFDPVWEIPGTTLDFSFWYRITPDTTSTRTATINYTLYDNMSGAIITDSIEYDLSLGDSGWVQLTEADIGDVSGKYLEQIIISVEPNGLVSSDFSAWIDDIQLGDPTNPLRYIGLAHDQQNLYLTGIQGGTQKFWYYDQSGLAAQGTSTFGAVGYTDPDNLTGGLFPVAKPGADNIIYAYGRDGNDLQLQYNDLNGTLGWQDITPGTATWGTAKFIAAVMIDPLAADDLVVAFSDDDIYTTPEGTANWVKLGDATQGVRVAARHPIRDNEILFAGTAAGSICWSPNWGVTMTDAGGTALGTVHWIEVSR